MRSIGKVNIKKLNKIVAEEYKAEKDANKYFCTSFSFVQLDEKIKNRIPEAWYDIWESAQDEIEQLINDMINDLVHGKVNV